MLQELHYTSARTGLSGSPGFQFVKLPEGIDPAICRQVEPLLGYEPPRSAPARPAADDIAAFPVALTHTLLPQGGAVLCNTTYTGTDYSGRYGNFYAHALYLPGGQADLGTVLPIETWRSASWCSGPGRPPAPVPDSGMERGTITDAALCSFAQQHHEHLEAVLTDVLHSFGDGGQRVLLAGDDADTAAMWIALACRALPPALAERLTFTTYTQRPYLSSHQVTGIPADADFAFSPAEVTSQYRVHAATPERSSPPAQPAAWAAAAAALWQAARPDLFTGAYNGLEVPERGPDAAWADVLAGQLAAIAVAHAVDIPAGVFSATVTWAQAHPGEGTPQFRENFAAAIGQGRGDLRASALGHLGHALAADWPAPVTERLVGAYLAALPAAVANDEADLDIDIARWAIRWLADHAGVAGAAESAIRDALPPALRAAMPLEWELVLLHLADALAIRDLPGTAISGTLGTALLAGGADARAAAAFLAATPSTVVREQVLDWLQDETRRNGGTSAATLASAVTGWAREEDLADFPLLNAAADLEHARQRGQVDGNVTAFHRVAGMLRGAGLDDTSRYALRMVWPDGDPTAGEARDLLACAQELPGRSTELDRACLQLLRHAGGVDDDIAQLAGLLQARPREWTDPRDAALVDLVAATGRLGAAPLYRREVRRQDDVATIVRLLRSSADVPRPVRAAATSALLAALLDPHRLEAADPIVEDGLHELAVSEDPRLVTAYVRHAERELPGKLAESAHLHASCFRLWRAEQGRPSGTAWLAARNTLLRRLLPAAAHKMTGPLRSRTAAELDRYKPGLGEEWRDLILQAAGPRPAWLSWPHHLFRRSS